MSTCAMCGKGFTPEEWEERHTAADGEDLHEQCCEREGACALEDPSELTEEQAREIASWWHDGQWSPLYAFASTGTTACDRFSLDDLMGEVRDCLPHAEEPKTERELASLLAYLEAQA